LRIALVDDHQAFRERLRALLERHPDFEIVAEASSGHQLLAIAMTTEMDVACMDVRLPDISGIQVTRRLLAIRPDVRVIGLSAYAEPHYVEAMLAAGAVGHFTKGDVGEALLQAIRTATPARPSFGADISVSPAADASPSSGQAPVPAAEAMPLGARELDVLRLIGNGLPAWQIARALSMDAVMVEVYRRNIMRKLNLNDASLDRFARVWALSRRGDEKAP
jgi:two-component system NarL family response regulator